jgi:hypothetical protein
MEPRAHVEVHPLAGATRLAGARACARNPAQHVASTQHCKRHMLWPQPLRMQLPSRACQLWGVSTVRRSPSSPKSWHHAPGAAGRTHLRLLGPSWLRLCKRSVCRRPLGSPVQQGSTTRPVTCTQQAGRHEPASACINTLCCFHPLAPMT